ncbi:hypothetical protein [Rhodococcus qingshengii]|nr:hypothetical protein [Rhodococcus qingshengii]
MTTVRREFLRSTLLARKTPPKMVAACVAATLAGDRRVSRPPSRAIPD